MRKNSTSWHDIHERLETLAQRYPEWQPSLQLWQAILYALDDPVWEAAVPPLCPDRPAAAPLLTGMVCHVDARRVGRWVRSLAKLARQNTAPGQAALLRVHFHQEDVLALLEAALCQDHARLTALAEGLGAHPHALVRGGLFEGAGLFVRGMQGTHGQDHGDGSPRQPLVRDV